ncbi:aminomethyl-transferring glycine dehydrogenase subunit GcvPA [Candidatus Thorarchaeota archaeon]|nr:MAG: aminomethyl-transferring glycine dehydrogenase subunit GcvPA [Candidatus Thorarchaeota archaeon]
MPVHPYIPNSTPEIKKKMLQEIGVESVEELFSCVPDNIKLKRPLNIPPPASEAEVVNTISGILSKNRYGSDLLSFLGAGCWPHYIPSVCNEINSRSEFVTAYTGDVYTDLGRYQVLFEFQSMIGELVGLDGVGFPLYDWSTACGDAARMATAITGRKKILVPASMSPEKRAVMQAHVEGLATVEKIPFFAEDGQVVLEEIEEKVSDETAAVYIENPTYLGYLESHAPEIGEIAHGHDALFLVGVEPLSLGLLEAPGKYGADIVCGEGQPLGIPTSFGGALMGFLAFKDEEEYVAASGNRMITLTDTAREGEFGFAYIMPERTIFCARDKANTSTGTATVLWAITAAVYLSLLGPQGIQELAEVIMQKSHYAMKKLGEIGGVNTPAFDAVHFKEFTVDFNECSKSVDDINKELLRHDIQGGKNLKYMFPELDETALYCVTEIHSQQDIDRLVATLEEVL